MFSYFNTDENECLFSLYFSLQLLAKNLSITKLAPVAGGFYCQSP